MKPKFLEDLRPRTQKLVTDVLAVTIPKEISEDDSLLIIIIMLETTMKSIQKEFFARTGGKTSANFDKEIDDICKEQKMELNSRLWFRIAMLDLMIDYITQRYTLGD